MRERTAMQVERAIELVLMKLPHGARLWVAVSGGRDSVTLFHLIQRLKKRRRLRQIGEIGIIHVNHGLRGRESAGDAVFVRKLAKQFGSPIRETKFKWKKGMKVGQAEAREAREAFYKEVLAEKRSSFLATAHHLDDQAETIFLRILRGTGVKGLAAMRERDGKKIRPLLHTQRSQIHSSAAELGLAWREDSSNEKTDYERNWLRLEILPLLEARRPGLARRLVKLAEDAQSKQLEK